MGKKLILALFAAFACIAAAAQNTIRVEVPEVVAADEQFNVTFIIEGENSPSSFSWEPGSEFQLVWGPQKGSSTSISIINGKRTRSSQTTYTYVLMPKKAGGFTIAAAHAEVKGNSISSSPKSINVVSGGSRSQSSGSSSSQNSGGNDPRQTGDIPADDLFMRLTLSRTSVVVGEPVTATLKLYHRTNIAGFEDAHFPSFNGFWSQEIQAPQNIEFKRESLNDVIYNSAVLRSWTLIPQQAGDIKIDPAELICLVNVRAPSRGNSIFDSFFQDEYQTIRRRVSTNAYTVHVSGLPSGAPASFTGAVGTGFKMSAGFTKDSLRTHDAASLKVTVTGKGNTSLLEAPKVDFPPDFEAYDVRTTDVPGGKTFEYPFIPRSHGDFQLEPVQFTYYDISAGRYVTLKSQPLDIRVSRNGDASAETTGGQLVPGVNRKDVRDVGSDIRFISSKMPSFSPVGSFFVGSAGFWVITVLLLLAAAAAYFAFRRVAALKADVAGSKNRAATKMARKRLSQAGEFLQKNLYTAFYEELHKTLSGFISDKLNMDAADMSKDNISEKLRANGVSDGLASEFVGLLDACEYARYSPDTGHDAMNAHYESAVSVISSIDESMKRKPRPTSAGAAVIAALLLILPSGVRAADTAVTDSLWNAGTAAYGEGRWEDASRSWSAIREAGLESPQLYYNIGNAYYKSGDVAHAILNYERALKLDPSYSDARFNLEFSQNLVQDKIEVIPEFFLETWGRKACWLLPSNVWAIFFIIGLIATLGLVLLFLLGRTAKTRKIGFFAGIVALLCTLLFLAFAFWQRTDYRKEDKAIITRAVTSVKSSPSGDASTDLFILHEGTRVTIIDEVGDWRNIELADGRQGWLKASDFEVI